MNKAEEILDKHINFRNWTKKIPKNGNLYNTLIDALNEALSLHIVVDTMGVFCECGKVKQSKDQSHCQDCIDEAFTSNQN